MTETAIRALDSMLEVAFALSVSVEEDCSTEPMIAARRAHAPFERNHLVDVSPCIASTSTWDYADAPGFICGIPNDANHSKT